MLCRRRFCKAPALSTMITVLHLQQQPGRQENNQKKKRGTRTEQAGDSVHAAPLCEEFHHDDDDKTMHCRPPPPAYVLGSPSDSVMDGHRERTLAPTGFLRLSWQESSRRGNLLGLASLLRL